jgi:hypothetical protein
VVICEPGWRAYTDTSFYDSKWFNIINNYERQKERLERFASECNTYLRKWKEEKEEWELYELQQALVQLEAEENSKEE